MRKRRKTAVRKMLGRLDELHAAPLFKCFAVADCLKKECWFLSIKGSNGVFVVNKRHSTKFKSFEELALNLELKFPGSWVCKDIAEIMHNVLELHEVHGISETVLEDYVRRLEPLL